MATVIVLLPPSRPAYAATLDVSADIAANRNIILAGDAVVRLTGGVTTYTAELSGEGTFTVAGTGTLVLTQDSDFTLPRSRQRQKLVTYNGNHPLTRVDNPDPPAVIVEHGATLQYGPGDGTTGSIGHYVAVPGFSWNTLNHQVDGVLDVAVHRQVHLGIMSGSGLITARRSTWPGLALAGTHPFSGTLVNGTGFDYGTNQYITALPNVRTIVNLGSAIFGAADGVTELAPATFYSKGWGNDINYHTWGTGVVRSTGVYSWSDHDSVTGPQLSDPALNFATIAKSPNKRGVNIEGATVEWGDGTTNKFFLPGNKNTVYINMHDDGRDRSRLTLNYNGPVTLGAPISGGRYHDTLAAPGQGDVVIAATPGNAVTFAAPQNYNGSTTIGAGASLRLGDGTPGGDSALLLGDLYQIVNQGELIIQNTSQGIILSKISGSGSLRQAGAATTTLTGQTTYHGPTTISAGTLAVTGGTLAGSSGVSLPTSGARLDLSHAGEQSITNLTGAAGTTVAVGDALALNTTAPSAYAGSLTAPGTTTITKTGPATLTLTGTHRTPAGTWTIHDGTLTLGAPTASIQATLLTVTAGAVLDAAGTLDANLDNSGAVTAAGFTIHGRYTQQRGATLTANHLTVTGPVTLAGSLKPAPDQTATVIDNTGGEPITGTFDGLPEGATIDGYRITYRGGDGNDVVLIGGRTTGSPLDRAATGAGAARWPWWVTTLAALVLVLAALAVVTVVRRRSRRSPRHHAE